jgi:hypothetical protein
LGGFGGALGEPWGIFEEALESQSNGYQQALGWLHPAWPILKGLCHSAQRWTAREKGVEVLRWGNIGEGPSTLIELHLGHGSRLLVRAKGVPVCPNQISQFVCFRPTPTALQAG